MFMGEVLAKGEWDISEAFTFRHLRLWTWDLEAVLHLDPSSALATTLHT